MKYHLVTAVLLLAAVALYLVGLSGVGTVAFIAGAALELWFWARVLVRRTPSKS